MGQNEPNMAPTRESGPDPQTTLRSQFQRHPCCVLGGEPPQPHGMGNPKGEFVPGSSWGPLVPCFLWGLPWNWDQRQEVVPLQWKPVSFCQVGLGPPRRGTSMEGGAHLRFHYSSCILQPPHGAPPLSQFFR